MRNLSIIENTKMATPMGANSILNPKGGRRKKMLMATVLLTSLVDAFSILVIYLLVTSSNSGEILYLSKDMILPTATQAEALSRNTIVKVEDGKYYIEEKEIPQAALVSALMEAKKNVEVSEGGEPAVTIQADKKATYRMLNTVIHASGQVGFNEIKFAVLAK